MSDLSATLRQVRAAMRLRSLRREHAELEWRHALQQASLARQSCQTETARYLFLLEQHQRCLTHGLTLNPAMHEQRLFALTAASAVVAGRQLDADGAKVRSQAVKCSLIKTVAEVERADIAKQRIARTMVRHRQARELAEIMDAQYRQGGHRGA